jgi:hypothetical protein
MNHRRQINRIFIALALTLLGRTEATVLYQLNDNSPMSHLDTVVVFHV